MKHIFTALLTGAALFAAAQKKGTPQTFASTITAADLKKHLYIVASREMAGRETGTEGERKAAAYIQNEFQRIGLQPGNGNSYLMPFGLMQDSLTGATLQVSNRTFEYDKDFSAQVANLPATFAFSEAVLIPKDFPVDSIRAADLAGRLVITYSDAARITELNKKGAAAVLIISNVFPRNTPSPRKAGLSTSVYKRQYGPQQFFISPSVAAAIAGKTAFNRMETVKTKLLLATQKTTITIPSANVVGVLPGTDKKDEYLFITAHYDHIGQRGDSIINYGADDDGSGTVSVIEMAEAFAAAAKKGRGPRRTIVFMAVSGEEKGLLGSGYYADNPLFPLEKTTANLNIDMIGRIDPSRTKGDSLNYVYVVGDDKLSSDLRTISEAQNNRYTQLELDYKFNDPADPMRIYYRSDHYNFAKNGVPIIFYFNGTHADYHRPTDTPDKINYNLMEKRARLVFYTAWEMANREAMLRRDLPLPELRR